VGFQQIVFTHPNYKKVKKSKGFKLLPVKVNYHIDWGRGTDGTHKQVRRVAGDVPDNQTRQFPILKSTCVYFFNFSNYTFSNIDISPIVL